MKTRIALFAIAVCLSPIVSQARWLNPDTGRFQTMDTYEGNQEEPKSLHKYTYGENDPVNNVDPDGHESIASVLVSFNISAMFAQISPTPMAEQVQQRARQVGRLSSTKFWTAYQKVNYETIPDAEHHKVWELIGGNVGGFHGPRDDNTCATRVSYGLNRGGLVIPSTTGSEMNFKDKAYKNQKGDGYRYIPRAADMNSYLTRTWGPPDYPQVGSVPQLNTIVTSLMAEQVAIFSTKVTPGHAGALKKGYQDPWVNSELPVDVWKLGTP